MASLADKMRMKENAGEIVNPTNVSGLLHVEAKEEIKPKTVSPKPEKTTNELEETIRDMKSQLREYKKKEEQEIAKKASQKKRGRKPTRNYDEYIRITLDIPKEMAADIDIALNFHRTRADYIRALISKDIKQNKEFYENFKENNQWQ